jgi:hypothetical protein
MADLTGPGIRQQLRKQSRAIPQIIAVTDSICPGLKSMSKRGARPIMANSRDKFTVNGENKPLISKAKSPFFSD